MVHLTKLKQVLNPQQSLIVVIDMQNDFCHPDGAMAIACKSTTDQDLSLIQEMIPRLDTFLKEARKYGVKIVFVQNLHDPKALQSSLDASFEQIVPGGRCLPGAWGADFVSPLRRIMARNFASVVDSGDILNTWKV